MATIRQHISDIRTRINEYTDDSRFTDQTIYRSLVTAKAKLLEQKRKTSQFNWKAFCIGLETVKSHDCDCVKVGCDVLRTVFPIPKPLTLNREDLLKVFTFDDTIIPRRTESQIKADATDDIKAGKLAYTIRNQHIIIWNNLDLKAIIVSGVWSDLAKWENIDLCDEDGNVVGVCYSIDNDEFGLDESLSYDANTMVVKDLVGARAIPSDMNNDSNPEILR
jgi:hypothetical protein